MKKYSELLDKFGVQATSSKPDIMQIWYDAATDLLNDGLAIKGDTLTAFKRLSLNSKYWNEQELKMNFFSPLLNSLKFPYGARIFYERKFSILQDGERISCKPDFILSLGILDENKPPTMLIGEIKPSINPEFQLVKAMCIVQTAHPETNYFCLGVSILGTVFKFYTLHDGKYFSTTGYDATDMEEFRQICAMLLAVSELYNDD